MTSYYVVDPEDYPYFKPDRIIHRRLGVIEYLPHIVQRVNNVVIYMRMDKDGYIKRMVRHNHKWRLYSRMFWSENMTELYYLGPGSFN